MELIQNPVRPAEKRLSYAISKLQAMEDIRDGLKLPATTLAVGGGIYGTKKLAGLKDLAKATREISINASIARRYAYLLKHNQDFLPAAKIIRDYHIKQVGKGLILPATAATAIAAIATAHNMHKEAGIKDLIKATKDLPKNIVIRNKLKKSIDVNEVANRIIYNAKIKKGLVIPKALGIASAEFGTGVAIGKFFNKEASIMDYVRATVRLPVNAIMLYRSNKLKVKQPIPMLTNEIKKGLIIPSSLLITRAGINVGESMNKKRGK